MDPVQEHSEAGVIISGSRINNLKFADDVDLIDKDERGLQQQVHSLHDNSERYGMHINQEKTKTMVSAAEKRRTNCVYPSITWR